MVRDEKPALLRPRGVPKGGPGARDSPPNSRDWQEAASVFRRACLWRGEDHGESNANDFVFYRHHAIFKDETNMRGTWKQRTWELEHRASLGAVAGDSDMVHRKTIMGPELVHGCVRNSVLMNNSGLLSILAAV